MNFMGICLITDDVPSLTHFYETILHTSASGSEIHSEVQTDGAGLAIYSKAAAQKDMGFSFDGYEGTGLVTLTFFVKDVDTEYEHLKTLGVTFLTSPTNYPWGNRAVHFRDPDGNIVGFACRVNP